MDTNNPHSHAENTPHGHGHADDMGGYVSPESLQRGHEEDKVDAKSILYVPLALVATFVLAYVVVTLLMNYVRAPSQEKPANPMAAKRNAESHNKRVADIKKPQLEGIEQIQGDDTFWRSSNPAATGNSRRFHPEDMRITSEYAKELGLQSYGWVDHKEKIIRIPVSEALKIALTLKDPKNPGANFLAVAPKPIPRDELKDPSKPSNPHWGAVTVDPQHNAKKEEDHKVHKDDKGKGKDHKD